jgi:hypothetical protein
MFGPITATNGRATLADATGWNHGLPLDMVPLRQMVTGSVLYFGEGQDVDILLHVANLDAWAEELDDKGWVVASEYDFDSGWFACRRGLVNLLVCEEEHYTAMMHAGLICAALAKVGVLKPDDKDMRVLIHRAATGEDSQDIVGAADGDKLELVLA